MRATPGQGRRILAETETHLREATAAGIEAGLTEQESQERDYERLPASHDAMVPWAMIDLMTGRLARPNLITMTE